MATKIRHDWYQSDNAVTISVFIKNVKQDQLKLELTERSVSINVQLPTGSNLIFDLDPLSHQVNVEASKYDILGSQIQLILQKTSPGVHWEKLLGEEEDPVTNATLTSTSHDYPTSSKTGRKNWDSITSEELTEKDDSTPDDFFKTLFKDADENTRKAMMKSYQESGGTALSTNWDEVSKAKVPVQPPTGMVAKEVSGTFESMQALIEYSVWQMKLFYRRYYARLKCMCTTKETPQEIKSMFVVNSPKLF